METSSLFDTIVSHGDTIMVAIVAIVLGWDRFRSGNSSLKKEIASDYKERKEQLDAKIKELEESIKSTNLEVARLTGTLEEKDKQIKMYTEIFQGRNPEMLEVLKEIKDFMKDLHSTMKTSKDELTYQTEILEKGVIRNKNIDDATASHKGEVLRLDVDKDIKSEEVK